MEVGLIAQRYNNRHVAILVTNCEPNQQSEYSTPPLVPDLPPNIDRIGLDVVGVCLIDV